MKNFIKLLFVLTAILLSNKSFANEKWEFFKDDEYCYIQSNPIKTLIPEGKTRGQHGMIVYRIHKSTDLIIQLTAGFDYQSSDSISVKVDENDYSFYTDSDTAWSKDDNKTIYAMKKGLEFTTTGISSMGTKVTDTYTLKGFTAAINKLTQDC